MHTRLHHPALALSFSLVAAACHLSSEDPTGSGPSALSGANGAPPAPAGAASSSSTPAADSRPAPPAPEGDHGAAFTISNAVDANEVLMIRRDKDGALANAGKIATGGKGTGKGLGSQGALALSNDRRFLVVVDPGSDEITSLAIRGSDLIVVSRVPSGGSMPVSVAMHGDLVYALNAGGAGCIAGFKMDPSGQLSALPDSIRSLSAASVAPAQVSFSPKGDVLAVTEKATNLIDTFVVQADGTPSDGAAQTSAGTTPFGFAFTPHGDLVVSEAFGGAAGAGAVSSYAIGAIRTDATGGPERDLSTISASVPDHQRAPCWVAVTADGRWAYTSNTASDDVSAYHVDPGGMLALVGDGAAGSTGAGSKPIDVALDRSTTHLMVLNSGSHTVVGFTVGGDGSLAPTASAAWVPETAAGLVAY